MTPDDFMMPAFALLLAPVVPLLLGWAAAAVFEPLRAVRDVRAAALWPCLAWVGIISFWGVRWVGPGLVERPGAPPALLFGASLGALAGLSAYHAVAWLRSAPTKPAPPIGAASGLIVAVSLVVATMLLWQRTDVRPEDAQKPPYDDEAQAAQLALYERRAQIDPWDPEIYIGRAHHAIRDGHLERAHEDLALARRVGAAATPLYALEADTLAALGRCDDARVAYDAWQQARTAEAMRTHFGHELEVLGAPEDDDSAPSGYLFDCQQSHYYGGE